jgi:hypothetical protein
MINRLRVPVHVVGVIENKRKQPVFNLEVEEDHEYFANGVLVHNCIWAASALFPGIVKPKSENKPKSQIHIPTGAWT